MLASVDTVRQGLARITDLAGEHGQQPPGLRVFTRINVLGGNAAVSQARAHGQGTPGVAAEPGKDSREQAIDLIGQYTAAGVTEIGLSFPWTTAAQFTERVEWVAAEIMPFT
jgi:hypothetical protein